MKNVTMTTVDKDAKFYRDVLLRLFKEKEGRYSASEIFNDWLEWLFYSIQAMLGESIEKYEDMMHRLVKKYNDRDFIDFQFLSFVFEEGIVSTKEDILGAVYIELEPDKRKGQFLTDTDACDFLVKMKADSPEIVKSKIKEIGGMTVDVPACGSGALLISIYKYYVTNGIDIDKIVFSGKDSNIHCVMMTNLQLEYLEMGAFIEWKDNTSDKFKERYFTTKLYEDIYGAEKIVDSTFDLFSRANKFNK